MKLFLGFHLLASIDRPDPSGQGAPETILGRPLGGRRWDCNAHKHGSADDMTERDK